MACGYSHNVLLLEDGEVIGWGSTGFGELDFQKPYTRPKEKVDLTGKKVRAIACGNAHTIFVLDDDTIETCGPDEEFTRGQTAIPPEYIGRIKYIACGGFFTLLLLDTDEIKMYGRIPGKTKKWRQWDVPDQPNPDGKKIHGIACGERYMVYLWTDGTVSTWGAKNEYGELDIPDDVAGKKVLAVSCGYAHTVLILDDGTVRAFGRSGEGQLEVPSLGGKKVIGAACGAFHTVLVLEDGSVRAFGAKNYWEGQTIVPHLEGRKVVRAMCGAFHTVLLLDDEQMIAFGLNLRGQCDVPYLRGRRWVKNPFDISHVPDGAFTSAS